MGAGIPERLNVIKTSIPHMNPIGTPSLSSLQGADCRGGNAALKLIYWDVVVEESWQLIQTRFLIYFQ